MKLRATLLALLATPLALVGALPKVTRTGRYLYSADGSRFFIKGIAYQTQGLVISGPDNPLGQPSTFVDNLADSAGCARDLPNLQKLGVNAIRAYSVDSTLNHDACMNALSGAGIYLILDLTLPLNGSIDTTQPTWSTNLLDQYLNTIDVFNKYDNVLAYNVGNEVLTSGATNAAPFLKAAARDIKAYLTSIGSSALVGYADIDGASTFRDSVADYLSCDPTSQNSGNTAIDLFGLNNYEWCGDAPSTTYDAVNSEFENYNVAAYFSEYGSENCSPGVRPWTEVGTLFASPMTNVWSGGIAFSYFNASSAGHQFGMATLSSDNTTVTTNQDFDNLVTQYGQINNASINTPTQSNAPAATYPACPTEGASLAASTALPATPNDSACDCLESKLSCLYNPPSADAATQIAVLGTLTGAVCGLLAQLPNGAGSSVCGDIGGNGTTGVYGVVSGCGPNTRLSYAFSQYYELTNRASTSCDFSGNATVNSASPTSSSASQLVSQCIPSPSAIVTPSAPAGGSVVSAGSNSSSSSGSSNGSSGNGSSGSSGGKSGAVPLVGEKVVMGVLSAVGCMVVGMGVVFGM